MPDFNREVLPLLTTTCFKCHGPDAAKREADLRLDVRDAAIRELDSGATAIVPGKPEASELIRRIVSQEEGERMPPADSHEQLTEQQIKVLRDWVAAGAPYDVYWAYAPIERPDVPQSDDGRRSKAIDYFVRRRLEAEGLKMSPAAERATLLRRLSFDVTGLPPSPEDVKRFAANKSSDAYEQEVDRLLASKHYGERMAMFWLDLVRYADTVGYHGDQEISVSPFRDYVIEAFNANMPYDQFTREQLGGDLLPDATLRQKIASGYNRLGMMSAEGGVQPKEYLAKYAAERVRNVSLVWMGATMGCCECHDHKYDPFTMVDFYSMASFFADIKEQGIYSGAHASGKWGPSIEYPDEQLPELLKPIEQQLAELQRKLNTPTPEIADAQAKWEQEVAAQPGWEVLRAESATALHNTELQIQADGAILAKGASAPQNSYTIVAKTKLAGITGFRLEVLPDKSLPNKGPGRAGNGNFVVTEFGVQQGEAEAERTTIQLQNATATIEQTVAGNANPYGKWSAASAIDSDVKGASWGWAILPETGKPNHLVVEAVKPIGDGDEISLQFVIDQNHTNPQHTLGKFRISATTSPHPLKAGDTGSIPERIRELVSKPNDKRTEKEQSELATYYRGIAPLLEDTRQKVADLTKQKAQLVKQHTRTSPITLAVKPRPMRVLPRGNWMDDSGDIVEPHVPHFLQQIEAKERATRLDLANWLVAEHNPLTARVLVNRLWKLYFGRGISPSLDDLGKQGQLPTHPQLLDWLAAEFRDSDWNVKHMVKLIVMSDTYRQSSVTDADARARDPYNELLARQSRHRLDAEMVRDNALAVSGLLVRKVGGRSVRPYQPSGYYAHLNFPRRTYKHDSGENLWRRSVYTHWQRQFLHPSLMAFDAPSREECTVERPRSNTPLAALVLLNDPIFVEASRAFAERALREPKQDSESRLAFIFQEALLREPRPEEAKLLRQVLEKYRADFQQDESAAQALIDIGERPTPKDLNVVELAAWTGVCRVIFNTHEFISRN